MPSQADNDKLAQTGAGAPLRVRLHGEDLIAFRATDGSVGLVDAFCPHRRAPMFFGRNEECGFYGLRIDGSVIEDITLNVAISDLK